MVHHNHFSFYHALGPGKAIYKVGQAGKRDKKAAKESVIAMLISLVLDRIRLDKFAYETGGY